MTCLISWTHYSTSINNPATPMSDKPSIYSTHHILHLQIIQALYYIISLVNDFVGTNELVPKRPPAIRKFKDWLMSTLAFPVALNVGVTFWTLYAIDRELVFPKVLDPVFPR